jgi:lipoyl-dependent peroxiredoxin
VRFDQVDGGWKVTTSTLKVTAVVPGIDDATFQAIAEDARDNCPISKALAGNVDLSVEAKLVSE